MSVSREIIQEWVYDNPNKPNGAMYKNNKSFFKIKNGKVYYYHESMKKWELSVMYNVNEVMGFYKCHR